MLNIFIILYIYVKEFNKIYAGDTFQKLMSYNDLNKPLADVEHNNKLNGIN